MIRNKRSLINKQVFGIMGNVSMSLFDNYEYDFYIKTEYCENDVKFGNLKKGDTVFIIDYKNCEVKSCIVTREWEAKRGKVSICIDKKRFDFGTTRNVNAAHSCNDSVAYFSDFMLGTNKESLVNIRKNSLEEEMKRYLEYVSACRKNIEMLNSI